MRFSTHGFRAENLFCENRSRLNDARQIGLKGGAQSNNMSDDRLRLQTGA